jgi:hypothetical protein
VSKKDSICINCGAAVTFEERDGELLASVRCAFCGAVNQRAQAELRERKAEERRLELESSARTRFLSFVGVGVALIAALGTAAALQQAGRGVTNAWADVERARAQVVNVRQRQAEVLARFGGQPPSPEQEAEVSGAANRVRVERRRYDEAAAAYNATAAGTLARAAAWLRGLPRAAPASDAVSW